MGFRVPTWGDIEEAFMRWLYGLFAPKPSKGTPHQHSWKYVTTRKVFDAKTIDKIDSGKVLKNEAVPLYNERIYDCACLEVKTVRI